MGGKRNKKDVKGYVAVGAEKGGTGNKKKKKIKKVGGKIKIRRKYE